MLLSYGGVCMAVTPAVVGTTFFALGAVCANAIRDRSEFAVVASVKSTKVRLSMSLSLLVVVCRALVDRLVHDRASHPKKVHHHSGSLFFPLREGRPV